MRNTFLIKQVKTHYGSKTTQLLKEQVLIARLMPRQVALS